MKKWIIALIATLSFTSLADAASFGVRLGYPIGVQYTTTDPGNAAGGFRIALNTFFFGDVTLQADYFFGSVPLSTDVPLSIYFGAGAHAGYFFFGSLRFGAQATGGLEYLLQPNLSLGVDLSLGLSFWLNFAFPIQPYFGGSFFVNFKI
jgi:hypothetical protein